MEELVVITETVTHAAARYLISGTTANVSITIIYTLKNVKNLLLVLVNIIFTMTLDTLLAVSQIASICPASLSRMILVSASNSINPSFHPSIHPSIHGPTR